VIIGVPVLEVILVLARSQQRICLWQFPEEKKQKQHSIEILLRSKKAQEMPKSITGIAE
jgi:hypothetical protein